MEVVHEVVEVDLPIEFGIGTLWKVTSRLFPTDTLLEEVFVDLKRMF